MTTANKQMVGVAVASLVLGILGLILLGPLGSIPAVICGHIAKSRIKKNPEMLTGDGLALAGLILGYVQIGFMILMLPLLAAIAIPNFVKARENAQTVACVSNMKMLEGAKEMAILMHNYTDGDTIPENQVSEYLKKEFSEVMCPRGGQYRINPVGEDPSCSEHGSLSDVMIRR